MKYGTNLFFSGGSNVQFFRKSPEELYDHTTHVCPVHAVAWKAKERTAAFAVPAVHMRTERSGECWWSIVALAHNRHDMNE